MITVYTGSKKIIFDDERLVGGAWYKIIADGGALQVASVTPIGGGFHGSPPIEEIVFACSGDWRVERSGHGEDFEI